MANYEHGIGLRLTITVIASLVLSIVPLPHVLDATRPDWLLLFVIYWSLTAPRIAGLLFAWLCGLTIDVLKGTLLGEHACGFLVIAFLTHRLQLRMRVFPILHQTATVFMLLAVYQFLMFWIDGVSGHPITTLWRWLPVFTGALLWPVIVAVMDTVQRRRA